MPTAFVSRRFALVFVTCALAGCGGGGGSSGGGSVVVAPTPTPTPAPTPAPSPSPTSTPAPTTFAAGAAAMYDLAPDVAACRAGLLTGAVKAELLASVNAVRALHGLAPVAYNDADDAQAADAALMMAANNALSHTPPTSWRCYTAAGATGAGSSNLYIAGGTGLTLARPDGHIAAWLNEGGSASLGHRRWILHPFLGKVTYGRLTQQLAGGSRVDSGVLKVFGFTGGRPAPATVPAFVGFPQGDYPIRYFRPGDYLSFSVAPSSVADGADSRVDLSAARVTVSAGGSAMTVTDVSRDNDGYGLANNLQWRVTGLQAGVTYDVRIAGVARAPRSEYGYSFRIVQ